jgi:transcriptional regulator with XRE-family HTH domain
METTRCLIRCLDRVYKLQIITPIGCFMAKASPHIRDPELAAALQSALGRGAFSPRDASRALRALGGYSQEDFAARLDLNVKVIRSLESGSGNPSYRSLEKIAEAAGLRLAFVKPGPAVGLLNPESRAADERRRRDADAHALKAAIISPRELHERNALRVDEVHFDLPKLT